MSWSNPNLLMMLIPAGVSVLGGLLAMWWQPNRYQRSLIQHFTAGVVLAVLAVEVLPEIGREKVDPSVLITAFALGSFFMYALRVWTENLEAKAHTNPTMADSGLIMATFIDVAIDGLIIGAGFAASGETGFILALGLSFEMLFLGLALTSDHIKGWRIVWLTLGLGLTILLFAVLGYSLLGDASSTEISAALAFSAAALLYLVTDELLIEAHEVEETPESSLVLFAGFLAFWAIQLYGSH
ncbi:MAG: ZIP family metal transporter [Thiotrichaceae bacterium]|uniref:Zinc permease n=1 Tax=Candidatus Thiocaldithrix dubininis TaxID=3080823 RepID=A0AA95KGL1_9GAMM|nr:MAG: zinc permease [Candidatus Thiocaldithrix dubininis]